MVQSGLKNEGGTLEKKNLKCTKTNAIWFRLHIYTLIQIWHRQDEQTNKNTLYDKKKSGHNNGKNGEDKIIDRT